MTNLFNQPRDTAPFQKHSDTSRGAAKAIRPHIFTKRQMVLDAIVHHGRHGLTDNEGVLWTGILGSTYRPRRIELMCQGLIAGRGKRNKSTVWVLCEYAR